MLDDTDLNGSREVSLAQVRNVAFKDIIDASLMSTAYWKSLVLSVLFLI